MDWSLQHFRFHRDDAVAMIFDWDSLRLVPETRLVGSAAACFTIRSDAASAGPPSGEEARAFVVAYERLRDTPFTADQWKAVSAAALYAVCYGARCEHCLGSAGDSRFRRRLLELPAWGYFEV